MAAGVQNLTIRDNQIAVSGADTSAIQLQDVAGAIAIANNAIRLTNTLPFLAPRLNQDAAAIEVQSNGTKLTTFTVINNQIDLVGPSGTGILLRLRDGSILDTLSLKDNTIGPNTGFSSGNFSGLAINVENNSAIASATVENNRLNTISFLNFKVLVQNNSSIDTLTLAGNSMRIWDNNYVSISVQENSTIKTLTIFKDSVPGILVNTLSNSAINSLTIANSNVNWSGLYINNLGQKPICAAITGNNLTPFVGVPISLSTNAPFRIVDLPNLLNVNRFGNWIVTNVASGPLFENVVSCP